MIQPSYDKSCSITSIYSYFLNPILSNHKTDESLLVCLFSVFDNKLTTISVVSDKNLNIDNSFYFLGIY